MDSIAQLLRKTHRNGGGAPSTEYTHSLQPGSHIALFQFRMNKLMPSLPSPIWPARIAVRSMVHGTYIQARQHAEQGADLALMVHEYSIVDGDRCSHDLGWCDLKVIQTAQSIQ